MRLLMTKRNPHLRDAISREGSSTHAPLFEEAFDMEDFDHPRDYPLWALTLESKVNGVILIDPVMELPNGEQFAYWTGWCRKIRNANLPLIMFSQEDPDTWARYRNRRVRSCGARPSDCHIYMTTDQETAMKSATKRRTVLLGRHPKQWNAEPLMRAIADFKAGRTYSPKRDGLYFPS